MNYENTWKRTHENFHSTYNVFDAFRKIARGPYKRDNTSLLTDSPTISTITNSKNIMDTFKKEMKNKRKQQMKESVGKLIEEKITQHSKKTIASQINEVNNEIKSMRSIYNNCMDTMDTMKDQLTLIMEALNIKTPKRKKQRI